MPSEGTKPFSKFIREGRPVATAPGWPNPSIVCRRNRRHCRGASHLACRTTERSLIELTGRGWTALRRRQRAEFDMVRGAPICTEKLRIGGVHRNRQQLAIVRQTGTSGRGPHHGRGG